MHGPLCQNFKNFQKFQKNYKNPDFRTDFGTEINQIFELKCAFIRASTSNKSFIEQPTQIRCTFESILNKWVAFEE